MTDAEINRALAELLTFTRDVDFKVNYRAMLAHISPGVPVETLDWLETLPENEQWLFISEILLPCEP